MRPWRNSRTARTHQSRTTKVCHPSSWGSLATIDTQTRDDQDGMGSKKCPHSRRWVNTRIQRSAYAHILTEKNTHGAPLSRWYEYLSSRIQDYQGSYPDWRRRSTHSQYSRWKYRIPWTLFPRRNHSITYSY